MEKKAEKLFAEGVTEGKAEGEARGIAKGKALGIALIEGYYRRKADAQLTR